MTKYTYTLYVNFIALVISTFTITTSFSQTALPDFVPGELIIGYNTEKAQKEASDKINNLNKTRGLFTPQQNQDSPFEIEVINETEIRLKLKTQNARNLSNTKQQQLENLNQLSDIIKKSDDTVSYAHPNWILKSYNEFDRNPVYLKNIVSKKSRALVNNDGKGPNDPVFQMGLHWHYAAPPKGMNAIKAWKMIKGDKKVVVAVLDTGQIFKHPDIEGSNNVLKGYDFISAPNRAGDNDGRDKDSTDVGDVCNENDQPSWHGTHVAGTIGGAITNNAKGISAVNWNISVLPVRVLGKCGGTIRDISDAIRWSAGLKIKNVPDNKHPADIINMSLGAVLECNPQRVGSIISAINAARQAGVSVVVAAGNDNLDVRKVMPGGCQNVISVAASDLRGHLSPYSNFGNVTIMAPGGDTRRDDDQDGLKDGVWSLVATSEDNPTGVVAYQGTSMATPHVSAALALAIAHNKDLKRNPDLQETLLKTSASKPVEGACTAQKPCGAGQLDAAALLTPLSIAKTKK